jgi:dephospho-CoA kinase
MIAGNMKLGLTGGIGCGKSTVVQFFKEAGWQTVESDAVVRELLAGDSEVRAELRQRWGGAVFAEDGGVDRKAVARK